MIRKMVLVPYDRWCNTKPDDAPPPPTDHITPPEDDLNKPDDVTPPDIQSLPVTKDVETQTDQVGGAARPPPGLPPIKRKQTIKWIKH